MSYEFVGRLIHVGRTDQVSDKFKKRDLVVSAVGQRYEQQPKFQFSQNNCDLLDRIGKGDLVKVTFDLSGREGKRKDGSKDWFTNLDAWRIEVLESVGNGDKLHVFNHQKSATTIAPQAEAALAGASDDFDDVPF